MKISLGAWSFTFGPYAASPKSLDEVCRRLAEAGYDGVELCGYPPHVTLEAYPDSASRAGLRRWLQNLGLGVSGYSSDLTVANPLVPGNRARYVDRFARLVELCHDVGSPSIRIDTIGAPGSLSDQEYAEGFERIAGVWHECAETASQAGVTVVWEFEPGFVFNKPSEIVALHDKVDHPSFRILLDTAHAYLCSVVGARQHGKPQVLAGGVCELLDLLKGRIGAVHVVDTDGTIYSDETSLHRPIHQGVVAWETVAPKLLATARVDWWCVDLAFCREAWESIDTSLQAVRELTRPAAGDWR